MKFNSLIVLILFFISTVIAQAAVTLPDIITEGMVLQREQKVPVWGTADPGEAITVRFAGQEIKCTADQEGKWKLYLNAMPANAKPATMEIIGKNTIQLNNILVGEVWLCAGQSNMQRTLSQTARGEKVRAGALHPLIRLFNVSREVAFQHETGPLATWQPCTPATVREFSAAGYYFGVALQNELGVPVGLINASFGGSQAEAWTPVEYLSASPDLRPTVDREKIWEKERPFVQAKYDEDMRAFQAAVKQARQEGNERPRRPGVPDALREYRIAASIYTTMIEPLIPFELRGVLWYQGESNQDRAEQYELLLTTMIRSWRDRWERPDLPFGIVQLPNFQAVAAEPLDKPWGHLREAQRRVAGKTPHTGLIVTIDIGAANDIHPKNKLDVGKRMFYWAMADVYGKDMQASGPMLEKAETEGAKMILHFNEVGEGLQIKNGDTLKEFAIAGADQHWYWAQAKIVGKDKVEVWAEQVPNPVAVRYAFNPNPENPNLTNHSGLPASPFRTDDWWGPTQGKR